MRLKGFTHFNEIRLQLLVCFSTGLRHSCRKDNVLGVAGRVMINKSSFASRMTCILSKSVVYVTARISSHCHNGKRARLVSNGSWFMKFSTN